MTYWVIANIKGKIHMAADIRSSSAVIPGWSSGGHQFSDGSEKLFYTSYVDAKHKAISFGICTSGFASGSGITIANLLHNYIKYLREKKIVLNTSSDVIKNFYFYLNQQSIQLYDKKIGLGDFIFDQTCFGVGIYLHDGSEIYQTSVSGWICRQWNIPGRLVGGVEGVYLEAGFGTRYIDVAYSPNQFPRCYSSSFKKFIEAQTSIKSPFGDRYGSDSTAIELITSVIFAARHEGRNRQTISNEMDIITIDDMGEIKEHNICKKQDIMYSSYMTSFDSGLDIHAVPVQNYRRSSCKKSDQSQQKQLQSESSGSRTAQPKQKQPQSESSSSRTTQHTHNSKSYWHSSRRASTPPPKQKQPTNSNRNKMG